ncbi:MAG: hypothetical protein FWB85_03855 [Chitinispirillia bacterium]|nr:hypothetical protein [Chitinispirillia bacterium]MCL2241516.1 hypothetical protein [Chitinispirillia bacterium]
MFKFKKLFGLALLTLAVGMFTAACESDPVEKEGYSVSVSGGKVADNGATAIFFEGDAVTVTATVPADSLFVRWDASGVVIPAASRTNPTLTFTMPANNVVLTAVFDATPPEPYTAEINNGTITFTDEVGETIVVEDGKTGIFFEKDKLILLAAEIPEGFRFLRWDVTPEIYNDNFYDYGGVVTGNPTKPTDRYMPFDSWFYMPAADVVITAVFTENIGYEAAINGGTITFTDEEEEEIIVKDGETGIFYGADRLVLLSATPPAGEVFIRWDVTPEIYNDNFYIYEDGYTDRYEASNSYFYMPDDDVVITAVFGVAPDFVDGAAEVRFTWEAAEQDKILAIAASKADVDAWYDFIESDPDFDPESMSDIPEFDGSAELPDNLFSSTIASTEYKGTYLPISAGHYTAVCSGEDEYGYFDIVANYVITINHATEDDDGADKWFEIAFDVGAFVGGDDDLGWFKDEYDNPNTDPRLEKKKVKKFFVKKVTSAGSADVTYYVIRRAKRA